MFCWIIMFILRFMLLNFVNNKIEFFDNPNCKNGLDLRCPQRGCRVVEDSKNKIFKCPCHNSTFKLDGTYIKGPAKKSLSKCTSN